MHFVEMKDISKNFGTVQALNNVSFNLNKGEIHSILGENGAGKTTLMKVLFGMCTPTQGEIYINEQKVSIKNALEAIKLGIGMVHQHFMLIPALSVAENIIAGVEPRNGLFIDFEQAENQVRALSDKYGFQVDPKKKIFELSTGEMQRVEILKNLYKGADILILDEPTAVLSPVEVKELFKALNQLKDLGKSIILITHKLHEVMEISQRITIMRDGRFIETIDNDDSITKEHLAYKMVGREVQLNIKRKSTQIGEPVLEVSDLQYKTKELQILNHIDLTICSGEILGIAGIEGNGQSELVEALTGLLNEAQSQITLYGEPVTGNTDAYLKKGIGHVPMDRSVRGLVLNMNIQENMILGYEQSPAFVKKGLFNWKAVNTYSNQLISRFGVKAPNSYSLLSELSGGNQQKVVIARVFSQNPKVVICAQPTRGVDVSAIEYIHQVMLDYRDQGHAILLISADLDEVKSLSDRMVVMYKGAFVAEGAPEDFDDTTLGMLMTGGLVKQ